jgi:hypothetical protein
MMMMMIALLHDACCALLYDASGGMHSHVKFVRAGAHLNELEGFVRRQDQAKAARSPDVMMSPSAAAAGEPAGINH